ncbi:MAG: porin family protein [Proteiniphilum sp.]|jgi:hypothetical protein|nr:porin family protein [Proteiniphilum sp.]MDD3780152.1 porin family protein [Proteiniphilum sp.]MDD3954866.1 porin family protein [Proteiniphilum sp.]NCB26509.1 PorT family protein [Bacteroidia bacterium]
MKPFLPILLLAIISINPVVAQKKDAFKSEFYLGVGGGAMSTSLDFMPTIQQAFMMGVKGGISTKVITEKHLGLVAEVNYAKRGWTEEFDPELDFSYSRTLDYLEIPVLTHIYFGKKLRFIVNAGPQISILLNDKQTMSQALADDIAEKQAADPEAPIGVQYSSSDALKKFDYGLTGGAGLELKMGRGNLNLEGRYYFGLGDLFESRRSQNAYFSRSAHRLIEAKLTYYIQIR